jgi:hypothetical protein
VGGTAAPRKLMLLLSGVRTRGRRFDSDFGPPTTLRQLPISCPAYKRGLFRDLARNRRADGGLWRARRGLRRGFAPPSLAGTLVAADPVVPEASRALIEDRRHRIPTGRCR